MLWLNPAEAKEELAPRRLTSLGGVLVQGAGNPSHAIAAKPSPISYPVRVFGDPLWQDPARRSELDRRLEAQGKEAKPEEYTTTLTVELERLPCWAHLSWGEYIRRVKDLVRKIEAEAALERERRGVEVVGAEVVCRRDPQVQPNSVKESPAPPVHAASKKKRIAWREAFSFFLVAYREASQLLREGVLPAPFPEGCFPPGLPFVGHAGGPAIAPG